MLSLKVKVLDNAVVKTMQFHAATEVGDVCRIIRSKVAEANIGQPNDYGLFLTDLDPKKGIWLEPLKKLDYYLLRNGDQVEYRKDIRTLKIRMLDGSVKTLLVHDSWPLEKLMQSVICSRIGITHADEYSLVREDGRQEREKVATLKRDKTLDKETRKMQLLKKKLHTDDELSWVDLSKTLREQGIDEGETLLLRRKYFFSDQNIDSRDPVQLNLLYVQCRDGILNGTHPVTIEKSCAVAGLQCQIQFGDHNEQKHKASMLDLREFFPKEYVKMKGLEKKVFQEHKKWSGLSEVDAKVEYTKQCRSLKTYGVTFFLVKEKVAGKNKLVPRLIGVTKDKILRLDEKSKEILKTWPLTTVRRWAASPNTFTLDFGDYSDNYYSVQTTDGEQIAQLIAGYIDIILKKKREKDYPGKEGDEEATLLEDTISPYKATVIQQGHAG